MSSATPKPTRLRLRELGIVVTEIGLKPAAPVEFIVIRIIHGQAGVEISDQQPETT